MNLNTDLNEPCPANGHSCEEVIRVMAAVSDFIEAGRDLLEIQLGFLDPTTWSLSQGLTYCKAFVEFHPTMYVQTLIGGLGVNTAALRLRIEEERRTNE